MTTQQMEARLRQQFSDAQVLVTDLTGQSNHFEVRIESNALKGLSRIHQHKAVMGVFADELKTGEVHAMTIKVLS
jgi:stress-induced morphogen